MIASQDHFLSEFGKIYLMLMIEFHDIFPKFLNLLMELTDFRLVLFSCFNESKVIS